MYNIKYTTMLPLEKCKELILMQPMEYECKWGTPLWYECKVLSNNQLLITFKGGMFQKAMRTQYLVEFSVENGKTVVTMRFHRETFGLPPMTPLKHIDLFMSQKIQAVRQGDASWD